jgi:hypothetical protein
MAGWCERLLDDSADNEGLQRELDVSVHFAKLEFFMSLSLTNVYGAFTVLSCIKQSESKHNIELAIINRCG